MNWLRFVLCFSFWGLLPGVGIRAATLPEGFVEAEVGSGWNEVVGLAFGKNGDGTKDRVYVWERAGRVWIVEDGVKLGTPLLDIREEVGGWRDYGMLGLALDPKFQTNGYFYVLYVVDRHHLLKFGTSAYSATTNEYYAATIGRVTRFTARRGDDFRSVDPGSRKVLLGETKSTGFPILHMSHGTGSLVFGTDGTLLAACGDGANYELTDIGGTTGGTHGPQAVADGIITAAENVGAFRSQMLDSLSGKIVRIDPATGDGIASNPYFQSGAPRSVRSRLWATGLRNPLRMSLKPGSGQHDPGTGDPGVLMIGDVGWNSAEDLEVADGPGRNFGWPLYEGYKQISSYWNERPAGMDAADWVKPKSSWRVGSYVLKPGGEVERFGSAAATVPGPDFNGYCSVGGVWYNGSDFPAEWRNVYFHGDYAGQWIRAFTMDANHFVTGQRPFLTGEAVTCIATHPDTGGLYYVTWGGGVKKVSYAPSGNRPPTAVATVSQTSGSSPLAVNFSSVGSSDPEGTGLIYAWNFGDGTTSTERNPRKTYTVADARAFTATLTVRDSGGATAQARVVVTVNNTAPTVTITSPAAGTTIPISGAAVTMPLTAAVTSPHPEAALSYRRKVFLHHNTHAHGEPEQTTATASAVLTPLVPSPSDYFYYRIVLTVTDPLGAQSTVERLILPAGSVAGAPPFATLGTPPAVVSGPFSIAVHFNEPVNGLTASDFTLTNGVATALSGAGAAYSLSVTPTTTGPVTVNLPPGTCLDAENLANVAGLAVSTFFLVAPAQPTPAPSTGGPGLKGEYFAGENFESPALTRIDPQLELYWPGETSPGPGVPGDAFSTRWTGRLTVPTSGSWQFLADVDDGMRLWVNGQLILDKWNPPPAIYWGLASSPLTLTAGLAYDFKVEYQDFYSDSYLKLRWTGPDTAPEVVPATAFSQPSSGPAIAPPSVRLTAAAAAIAPFTVTAAFTEPVTGLMPADFEVTNGTAGNLTGSGANYAITITPAAVGPVTIYLPTAAAVGAAANPSLDSNQIEVIYTRPQSTSAPGLRGDYFAGENFGTFKLTRIDPRLEFYWPGATSPGAGVPGDVFSTRWTGRITVPTSGSWQFLADVDDGMRLWVNGQLILDKWNPPPAIYWGLASTPLTLTAGIAYDFKIEYQDFYSDSYLKLRWTGPGTAPEVVPATAFSQPSSSPVITPAGLKGEYYAGQNFGTLKLTRIDPRLEFYWPGTTSPGAGVPGDYFSARWTGRLTVPTSGSWQFSADVDDGMRLWVNGQLIIDKWNPPPAIYWGLTSSPVTLTGGVAYDFKVEYQEFYAGSHLKLRWAGPGTQAQIVPATAFSQPTDGASSTSGGGAGTGQGGVEETVDAAMEAAAQADLPRLERSLAVAPQADGTFELQFTRQPGLRRATVLQVSDTMVHWHDIFDPGWPVTQLADGTELVHVPRACCLLVGHDGTTGYFRVRAGR